MVISFVGRPETAAAEESDGLPAEAFATLKAAIGEVPSRVIGSPEPPLPYRVEQVLTNLEPSWPVFVINEPGSRRLLVIDQKWSSGPARLCCTGEDPESGGLETLLEIPAEGVAYCVAFHPKYQENGFIYLGWNGARDGDEKRSYITRYTVARDEPFRVDAESELTIIDWPSNGHNGAALDFGTDGMLYITSGDGTSDSDTDEMGQGLDHLLAKVLRIDVDNPDEGRAYSVPPDNPFVDMPDARPETWAYGFRNPWRLSVDRRTGDVWVGNNGQDLWEQIYRVERGANYGWSVYEGSEPFYPNRPLGPTPVSEPTFDHPHSEARSMTGGVVYYGDRLAELDGAYVYGDYSTGKIWGAKVQSGEVVWHRELADTTLQITSFAVDADGQLLISDHRRQGEGGFYALVPNPDDGTQAESFPRTLSESGLFASVPEHRMHPGVIPYSVNSPLWSDAAHKDRFIALPSDDPTITVRKKRGWDFPDRAVLVKSFSLDMDETDPSSRRLIETRFMTRQNGEWVGYSYLWNDDQTDAELVGAEGTNRNYEVRTADGTLRDQPWRFPSRTECMVCHSRAANFVLGTSTLQLNRDHEYAGGVTANQLRVLDHLGVLDGNDKSHALAAADTADDKDAVAKHGSAVRLVDPYDDSQDLTLRARSYLHANCAQCHVNAGGGNAQIDLEFDTPPAKMKAIGVEPLHHKFDIPDAKLIAPGDPDRSVLLHRTAVRGRNSGQMPQLATAQVDHAAVAMLREWITQLSVDEAAEE